MYEILKAFATLKGWVFEYGRSDFQNLFNSAEQKDVSHLFLDPVKIGKRRNDTGGVEAMVYTGSFMLLYSSEIDEIGYEERYLKYIKPIVMTKIELIETDLICVQEAKIELWEIVEVINMFDYNLDGVIVNYKLNIDL